MQASDFLTIFPEFADATLYPTARITFWLGVASNQINPVRWAALADQGQALLTAHYLVIDRRNTKTPGAVSGVVTSKSVDGVSVSMDAGAVTMDQAGHYNQSNYGIQYWQLAQMMGAGGLQFSA